MYAHTSKEDSHEDTIRFTVINKINQTRIGIFKILIEPIDRILPSLDRNIPLTVIQDETVTLTAANLHISDPDTPPSNLTYVIVEAPRFGVLLLRGFSVSQFTQYEQSMGCLEHLAPESFNATGTLDPSNDVWALGVMTYKLTTGQAPFHGQTPVSFAQAIQRRDPDWSRLEGRGYSSELVRIIRGMLQKEPAERTSIEHLLNMRYFRDV